MSKLANDGDNTSIVNNESTEIEKGKGVANQGISNKICEEKVHEALGGTKCGKVIGADKIPVEEWTCMGKFGVQLLWRLLNSVLKTETNGEEAYWCQFL